MTISLKHGALIRIHTVAMIKHDRQSGRVGGGALPWAIMLLAVASLAVYFLTTKRAVPPAPPALAARIPAPVSPITPLSPSPEPEKPAAEQTAPPTPTPAPAPVPVPEAVAIATPTPAPTPPPLDLATVARTPRLWPPQVALQQPVSFPLVLEGRVIGQAQAKVGTLLRLLNVREGQVEIEFQNVRHVIPSASTDLLQRALLRLTDDGSAPGNVSRGMNVRLPPNPMESRTQAAASTAPPAQKPGELDLARLRDRIKVDFVPANKTENRPGYYGEKRDEFTLKVKFSNTDNFAAAENLKCEIYIFGESCRDRSVRRLLAYEDVTVSVPPHGVQEVKTKEVKTTYDDLGTYRTGVKYEAWFVRLRNSAGELVFVKSSQDSLTKSAAKITGLKVEAYYSKKTFDVTTYPQ